MKRVISAALVVSCAAGCTIMEQQNQFDPAKADQITIGKSTKQDVVSLLGPANKQSLLPDGEMWTYFNMDEMKMNPIISPFTNLNQKSGHSFLTIQFRNNVVADCKVSESSTTQNRRAFSMSLGDISGKTIERRCGDPS